jgi:hypothetical protein
LPQACIESITVAEVQDAVARRLSRLGRQTDAAST